MSPVVWIAMLGCVPVVLVIFQALPVRPAVVTAYLFGWLFLPVAAIDIPGLPDLTKESITNVAVLLGLLLRDPERFRATRLRWFDWPAILWCLCPAASVLANGLGAYDAMSFSLTQTIDWGLPYLIGRVALGDPEGVDVLARGLVVGGLIYVPFCLWEIRMAPTLHHMVYGFTPRTAWQTVVRYGGYRPVVFMQTGLAVGMWMVSATLLGIWLWSSGRLRQLGPWRFGPILLVLLATTILCKSTGALALMLAGLACLACLRLGRWPATILVLTLLFLPTFYAVSRSTGLWSGRSITWLAAALTNEERAASLEFRMDNEDVLAARALERPLLGWAGWGRNRVTSEDNLRIITDGYWIIILGVNGFIGLGLATLILLLPGLRLWWHHPVTTWGRPPVDAAASLVILLGLVMVDNLSNAMFNPIHVLAAGAVIGLRLPSTTRSPLVEAAAAAETYRDLVLDDRPTTTGAARLQHAEAIEAAGWELDQVIREAEQSETVADGGEALVLDLIQLDLELARDLRAHGLEAEAGERYRLALERGERLLERLATRAPHPAAHDPGQPSVPIWDPARPETIAAGWARGIALWERLEAIAPDLPEIRANRAEACNNLAWLLAFDTSLPIHDLDRAHDLATTAVSLGSDQASHWNTLALVQVRRGAWGPAALALDRAGRLIQGPSPFNLYVLAIVHAHQGEPSAARDAFQLADSLALRTQETSGDLLALRSEAAACLETPRAALTKPS